jgi:hypothetical protein
LGFGAWNLVLGIWCLEFGTWNLVLGIWCLEFGTWNLVLGIWYLEFGTWNLVFIGIVSLIRSVYQLLIYAPITSVFDCVYLGKFANR